MRIRLLALLAAILVGVGSASSTIAANLGTEHLPSQILSTPPHGLVDKAPVVTGVALDAAGQTVLSVGDDHLVRIWSVANGQPSQTLSGHLDWIRAVAMRSDGRRFATAGHDRRVRIWDAQTHGLAYQSQQQETVVHDLAYSGDGKWLAAACFDNKVRMFDGEDARLLRTLDAPGRDMRAVAFSPDSARLAAGGRSGTIRIWEVSTGNAVADLPGGYRRIMTLAWSPRGNLLAAGGDGGRIELWDVASKKLTATLADSGCVMSLAFCGETTLAAGDSTNCIGLWNITTRQPAGRLVGHTGSVASLAYCPATGQLVSGSFDTTIRIWPVGQTRD